MVCMELTASSPADPGYLGPAAIAWPVLTHPGSLIGGLRALLIQSLPVLASGLKHIERSTACRLKRIDWLIKGNTNVTLSTEVVNFIGLHFLNNPNQVR